jgi:DNA-binding SARP family transcriptional activator
MTVELTLLGAFSARCGDATVAFPTRKAQALLAYLALRPDRPHEREQLCGLLWGETGRDQAYSSLRQTLFGIRKALPPQVRDAVVASGRTVALDPALMRVDATQFERQAAEPTRAALEQAAELYRGPLLEGFVLDEAGFEEWLSVERSRFAALASAALAKLAQLQTEEGALDRAIQTRLQLVRLEPWEEDNHRRLMSLYARQGRRAAALAQYQQCAAALQRELGVEPEQATRQLYEELAAAEVPASAVARASTTSSRAEPRASTSATPAAARMQRVPPARLVGRGQELERLRAALDDACNGSGTVALLVGEAGVGKTRLLEELAASASERGASVVRGRCFESEQVLPFAPWVDALRGESTLFDRALWQSLSPAFRRELSRLLPWDEAPASDIPSQENALRLFDALLALLSRAAERRPLLVLLDDLHWADDMSLRLLSYLGRRLAGGPRILVAASLRREELAPDSFLATALAELSREGCSLGLEVAPLSQLDTAALVESLGQREATQVEAHVQEQIWGLSEGNPFVVLEAVRALAQGALAADVASLPVPQRVREVIAGHVTRLGSFEQQLVAVAAVIGREFEFALLQSAAECDADAAASAVDGLVRVGIFKSSGEKLYFAHERIREVVYAGLLAPRRKVLHGHVARALCQLHEAALHEVYGPLAFHYGRADDPRAAVTYLTRFADNAARTFGLSEALSALAEAHEFSARLPQEERAECRLEIAVRRAKCLFHLGRFVEIGACLQPHLSALEGLQRPDLSAQVHFWLGCASGLLGDSAQAASNGERALAAAQQGNAVKTARRAHTLLAWESAYGGRFQKGVEHGLAATVSLTAADAEPEYESSGWMTAGVNYLYSGRHDEALSALERAGAIARASSVPRVEALSLGLSGLTRAERGEHAEALSACLRAVELAPDPVSTAGTLSLLAHVHVRAERHAEALHILRHLIDDTQAHMHPGQAGSLLAVAEACLMLGDAERARLLSERALASARGAQHRLIEGALLRILGESRAQLGELEAGRALLEDSCELLASLNAAFQLGRSLCALGLLARRMGDSAAAAARLEQAVQLYRRLGLQAAGQRSAELLRETHAFSAPA